MVIKAIYFLIIIVFSILWQNSFALEPTYFKAQKFDIPFREEAIIIGENGFYPNRISVFKGEKVRFFVTSTLKDKGCFNIPAKNIFSSPSKGKIIETEVFFEDSGTFVINCPNMQFSAHIVVQEKSADKFEAKRRGLASDVVKVWKPKDSPTEWTQENFEDESNLNLHDKDIKDFPRYRLMEFRSRDLASE